MPYQKSYTTKTVGKGGSKTPESVMGSQGKPAPIKESFYHNRPTGNTPFPGGKKSEVKKNPKKK